MSQSLLTFTIMAAFLALFVYLLLAGASAAVLSHEEDILLAGDPGFTFLFVMLMGVMTFGLASIASILMCASEHGLRAFHPWRLPK